jgi:hypothetical protein
MTGKKEGVWISIWSSSAETSSFLRRGRSNPVKMATGKNRLSRVIRQGDH